MKFKSTMRSLSVIIDSKKNWKAQVAKHFQESIYFNLRKHLIETVFPIVDYCFLVSYDLSNELIQVAMNAEIRHVFRITNPD